VQLHALWGGELAGVTATSSALHDAGGGADSPRSTPAVALGALRGTLHGVAVAHRRQAWASVVQEIKVRASMCLF
jgi:hypothetical protein